MDDSLFDEFGNYIGPEEGESEGEGEGEGGVGGGEEYQELDDGFETGFANEPVDRTFILDRPSHAS